MKETEKTKQNKTKYQTKTNKKPQQSGESKTFEKQ